MKKAKKISFFLTIVGLSFGACKDDSSSPTVAPISPTSKLIDKNFFPTYSQIIINNDTIQTLLEHQISDCDRDNFRRFNANGTFEINQGIKNCDVTNVQSREYDWKFYMGSEKIILDYRSSIENIDTLEIIKNTDSILHLILNKTLTNGSKIRNETIYKVK